MKNRLSRVVILLLFIVPVVSKAIAPDFKPGDTMLNFMNNAFFSERTYGLKNNLLIPAEYTAPCMAMNSFIFLVDAKSISGGSLGGDIEKSKPSAYWWSAPILVKRAFIIGFLIFVIAAGSLSYNQRRRKNAVIESLEKEINDKSFCLDQANEERDWLVKEIHHRVKNNLQIVTSLLNTQMSYLTNNEALKAIRNSQHRMYAISLVHQKLYQADSLSNIDMVVYIHELLEYLQDVYEVENKVNFKLNLMPLNLDVSMALPFGLIVNEAISNTLRFAFPGKSKGEVTVSLSTTDQKAYTFVIADNGIGLQDDNGKENSAGSFGRSLMAGLANQLQGTYEIKNNKGVEVIIKFNKKQEPASV